MQRNPPPDLNITEPKQYFSILSRANKTGPQLADLFALTPPNINFGNDGGDASFYNRCITNIIHPFTLHPPKQAVVVI